jgi:hypothetical protein
MDCTLYLPYIDYDDSDFNMNNNYYQSEEEYTSILEKSYDMDRDIVANTMNDWKNGTESSIVGSQSHRNQYVNPFFSNVNSSSKEEKTIYSKCQGTLYNELEEKETIDSILEYFRNEDVFISIIKFNLDDMDEEFEADLKLWYKNHENINNIEDADEDWKFNKEPMRNLKFTFQNKSGNTSYGELLNCKIVDRLDMETYAILVEKIIFTKEF